MDPLTHAATGASLTLLLSKPDQRKWALFCGIIAATIPDLDIFIRSSENPLLTIQYHRHFTHSLFFVPFGAMIASWLVLLFARQKIAWKDLYRYCFLSYLTHPFLDAATSYGTHLLWPFTNDRVAWSIVPVVDPIPTLILLIGVVVALKARRNRALIFSISGFFLYLLLGGIQKSAIEGALRETARSRGHSIDKYDVKPSILQILVWRTIYASEGVLYVDAFQKIPFREAVHYQGGELPQYFYQHETRVSRGTVAYNDLKKFSYFSDEYVAETKGEPLFIGDIRFALLPHQTKPLWGVRLSPEAPEKHLPFENHRHMESNTWEIFGRMICGRPIGHLHESP